MDKELEKKKIELLNLKNVVAVGEGLDGVLEVSVTQKINESRLSAAQIVPKSVMGHKTNVTQTGEFRALAYTEKMRPAPGGVSVGHPAITAGTLGTWFRGRDDKWYILSNNHVLAASNNAEIGDAIIQPGTHDGGKSPRDDIAILTDFVPIKWRQSDDDDNGCPFAKIENWFHKLVNSRYRTIKVFGDDSNLVDCAIAQVINSEDVNPEILDIGIYSGVNDEYEIGQVVKKTGRTTEHTRSKIIQLNVSALVGYGNNRTALFTDQIFIDNDNNFGGGGDSGSAILDENNRLNGLLFAGSDTRIIANKIRNVEEGLQITL